MTLEQFNDEMEELSSAEDFLNYFQVKYDPSVVHVNRLHILQRFHDYLYQAGDRLPEDATARREVHKRLLERAYQDFVTSNALTEKVFKVFQDPGSGFISLDDFARNLTISGN